MAQIWMHHLTIIQRASWQLVLRLVMRLPLSVGPMTLLHLPTILIVLWVILAVDLAAIAHILSYIVKQFH